jgi:hypothetical protein
MSAFVARIAQSLCVVGTLAAQTAPAQDPGEIELLLKACVKKQQGSSVAPVVKQVEARVKADVPEWAADTGWLASIRAMAARMTTPVAGVKNEFGQVHQANLSTSHPPPPPPLEIFRPRTVVYRFAERTYFDVAKSKASGPLEPKDVPPEHQLWWLLAGHPPEVELAVAAIQHELDIDRSRDKLSRFLEYWRNGRESFYEALDRTAGTKEAIFFYDSMLAEFVARVAPELATARGLAEKHDRLHQAFLTLRQYRRFIETASITLVSTDPFPARLKDFEYSAVAGSAQVRDALEVLIASHRCDLAAVLQDLKAVLEANPMPPTPWDKYDPPTIFTRWYQENAEKLRAAVAAADPGAAGLNDVALALRCRTKRRDLEDKVRLAVRTCLEPGGSPTSR